MTPIALVVVMTGTILHSLLLSESQASGLPVIPVPVSAAQTRAVNVADDTAATACHDPNQVSADADATPVTTLNDDVPAGITWTVLASSVADQLPDAPARLLLTRVLLDRDAGSEAVRAAGAVLYYVENGSVVIYVDGDPFIVSAKSAVFVPMHATYAIVNTGDDQASLLRLAVAPPGTNDQTVASVVTPEPLLRTPPASRPIAQVLVRGRVSPLPAPPARLFIACLNFPSGNATPLIHRHPGPIGLLVERGGLEVDGFRNLPESGCALLQSTTAHALRPPQDGASVMVFGIAADGRQFWSAADASDVPASAPPLAAEDLTCGSP